jgi:hypothetical protein
MKKVAVCISGQYRSFDQCLPYILENFINANKDYEILVFICFGKEKGKHIKIPKEIYDLSSTIKIESDPPLPNLDYQIEKYVRQGFNLDSQKDSRGFYYQLKQLKSIYNLVLEYEKENGIEFDYIARVRPDIWFKSPFDWNLSDNHITILKYDDFKGYNDKFAIGPKKLMSTYMNRVDDWMSENNKENYTTHAESNLKFLLDENNIQVNRTDMEYDYVRYNDENNRRLEIVSIDYNKIMYKNISDEILNIKLKIYNKLNKTSGEQSKQILYSTNVTLHPNVVYYSINEDNQPDKFVSLEAKDLYLEYKMN